MQLHQIFSICEAYDRLGTAVQKQVRGVCEGEAWEDQNPNALKLGQRFIDVCRKHGIDVTDWDTARDEHEEQARDEARMDAEEQGG